MSSLDADLATLRLEDGSIPSYRRQSYLEALDRVEAEVARLREERDAIMAIVSAPRPPDYVFRFFQRLHELPETGAPVNPELARLQEGLQLAAYAFAQYALNTNEPPQDAVADFVEGFLQEASTRALLAKDEA